MIEYMGTPYPPSLLEKWVVRNPMPGEVSVWPGLAEHRRGGCAVLDFRLKLYLGVATLLVSGCDNPANNRGICSDPPSLSRDMERFSKPSLSNADSAFGFATGCVHRWSYSLARSKEPAEVVSRAVVDGACRLAVTRSGERDYFLQQSLFHVVQARAGRCKVP